MDISRFLTIIGFITIGLLSRLLPHPPNFTAINAIALCGACYLGSRWLSFATVLSIVFLTDITLGFHSTMSFVYFSFGLTILIGYKLKNNIALQSIPIVSLATSLLFFLVTNFGIWMVDSLYPKTLTGLGVCYVAAIPFMMNQVLGDLIYSVVLFGYVQLIEKAYPTKKLA